MTTRTMDKKIDELKTYLKEICNNLVEKCTSELTGKLQIQAERIDHLENDKR